MFAILVLLCCASHFFGGPLAHHYLYVSPSEVSPPSTPVEGPTTAASGSLLPKKNNRSHTLTSRLHAIRTLILGVDESARRMRVFRAVQRRVWRLYKLLLRRVLKTGELERMVAESGISMVPLGNCMSERVGFHPHLVSLAVRIAAYLRTSDQLRQVLALEAESNTAERIAASAARSTAPGAAGSGVSDDPSDVPGEGDEDETPMSTPAMGGSNGPERDPPNLALGGDMSTTSPASSSSMFTPRRFTNDFSPLSLPNASPAASESAAAGGASPSSGFASLPHPPPLQLSPDPSDEFTSLVHADRRANHLVQLIVAVKHVSRTSGVAYSQLFRPVLYRALLYRNELEDFLASQLAPVLDVKYDQENVAHERWLQELWEVYMPLGPSRSSPSSRFTSEWSSLGFQGDNPATDFRGMGILGLRNLIEFGRVCPIQAQLIMRHSQEYGLEWFPFAVAGIGLTADLVALARDHVFDAYFYTYGANWNSWHALYAAVYVRFDEAWQEAKPENVMSFSSVKSSFLAQLRAESLCFPFSPRSLASSAFHISSITPVTPRILAADGVGDVGDEDDDEEFEIEGMQRVTEGLVSRAGSSKASAWSSSGGGGLSRSASPFDSRSRSQSGSGRSRSHSQSRRSQPSSPNSNSPALHALSRSDMLDAGGVLPLGNMIDPLHGAAPTIFARHTLPNWRAT